METSHSDIHFSVQTPLGFCVRVTHSYWYLISMIKHPVMADFELAVMETLESPGEIRISKSDANVFLFYKLERIGRWVCAVARKLNKDGFLITAYLTDAKKEGVRVWPK